MLKFADGGGQISRKQKNSGEALYISKYVWDSRVGHDVARSYSRVVGDDHGRKQRAREEREKERETSRMEGSLCVICGAGSS